MGDHALMIGRVLYAEYNPEFFDQEGYPIAQKIKPLYYAGNDICCTIDKKSIRVANIKS